MKLVSTPKSFVTVYTVYFVTSLISELAKLPELYTRLTWYPWSQSCFRFTHTHTETCISRKQNEIGQASFTRTLVRTIRTNVQFTRRCTSVRTWVSIKREDAWHLLSRPLAYLRIFPKGVLLIYHKNLIYIMYFLVFRLNHRRNNRNNIELFTATLIIMISRQ